MSGTNDGPGASHIYSGVVANQGVRTFHDLPVTNYDEARNMHDTLIELLNRAGSRSGSRFCHGPQQALCLTHNARGNVYISEFTPDGMSTRWGQYPPSYEIILYRTPIVRYYPDGTFSVDNGGFNTPTTSSRVSQFTPDWFTGQHERKKLVTRVSKWQDITNGEPVPQGAEVFKAYNQAWLVCTHDVRLPVKRGAV
jgi:hypothetical protein